ILSYIKLVPCFPTTSIRSLLVSIDAFFQTQFEASCQQVINHLLEESEQIVADPDIVLHLKHTKKNSFQLPTVLNHLNHIIDLVKLGNTQLLKQEINRLPSSSVTSSSIPALRAEKNLTVV
ncbi:AraC family transcriptional regulator, partial [Streptococcus agalactiae]|nr:AraC family transcriptional regulator [Streptococcus agalactiae]